MKLTNEKNAKKNEKKTQKKAIPVEYYDLPYRYNQTVIKVLAQTPHSLFVYWDISDEDKLQMLKKYGEDFFEKTKPILFVQNKTKNMSYEVEINDFANSWYLKTPTSNCEFSITLGRKNKNPNEIIKIVNSNNIVSPNDHFLTETVQETMLFENTKTKKQKNEVVKIEHLNKLYKDIDFAQKEFYSNPSSAFKI